jgi:hypothetical protein
MLSNYYYTPPRTALSLFCTPRGLHACQCVYTHLLLKLSARLYIYRHRHEKEAHTLRSEQPVGDLVITRAGTLFAPFNSPLLARLIIHKVEVTTFNY